MLVYIIRLYYNSRCKKHKIINFYCNLYVHVRSKKTFLHFQSSIMGCLNYKINHPLVTEFRQKDWSKRLNITFWITAIAFSSRINLLLEFLQEKRWFLPRHVSVINCIWNLNNIISWHFPSHSENITVYNQCGFQGTISTTCQMFCIR